MMAFTYLAWGSIDGTLVMKVGKTTSIERRQSQLPIEIDKWVEFDTEAEAFALETKIRRLGFSFGVPRFGDSNDWFEFSELVYLAMGQELHETGHVVFHNPVLTEGFRLEIAQADLKCKQIKTELPLLYAQIEGLKLALRPKG